VSTWFQKHSKVLRRSSQIFSLLFLIAIPILNKYGIDAIVGTLYSIDIFGWTIVDPAMLLQVLLLGEGFPWILLLGLLIPAILALLLGRIFCSWMCPYNFFAEGLNCLKKHFFPGSKLRKHNPPRRYSWISLALVFGAIAITGFPLIVFFSMPGLISAEIAGFFSSEALGVELAFVAGLLFLDVFVMRRAWCKYLCPVGGVLSLMRTPFTVHVKAEHTACADCDRKKDQLCRKACPLDLDPRHSKDLYPGCYNCLDCVDTCQRHGGALSLKMLEVHPTVNKENS